MSYRIRFASPKFCRQIDCRIVGMHYDDVVSVINDLREALLQRDDLNDSLGPDRDLYDGVYEVVDNATDKVTHWPSFNWTLRQHDPDELPF